MTTTDPRPINLGALHLAPGEAGELFSLRHTAAPLPLRIDAPSFEVDGRPVASFAYGGVDGQRALPPRRV